MRKIVLINTLIPLLIGVCFYLPLTAAFLGKVVFLRNHLPDMLWSYSFTMALFFIYENHHKLIGIIVMLIGSFLELLQRQNIIPGTFDYIDILLEMVAAIFAVYIITTVLRRQKT